MNHANTSDVPPLRREELPPGSNYRFRSLTREEDQLLNIMIARGGCEELIATCRFERRDDLANLMASIQRQQDDLYRLLQIRGSINILDTNLETIKQHCYDAVSILLRYRNDDFRVLVNSGILDFLPGMQALITAPTPLGQFRPSVHCQHCSRVGHFPVECTSFHCTHCRQPAPGHTPSQCPSQRGNAPTQEVDHGEQAPLPIRPPEMLPTQRSTRPRPSPSPEYPSRRNSPPEFPIRRNSPPGLSRASSTSSLSEPPAPEEDRTVLSILEAVEYVRRLPSLATIASGVRPDGPPIPTRPESSEEDYMDDQA